MFPHKAGKLGWFITNIVVPKVQTLFLCDIQFIWMQPQNCENNISLKLVQVKKKILGLSKYFCLVSRKV